MNININKLISIKKLLKGLLSNNDYIWNFLNASAIKKYNSSKLVLREHEQQLLDDLKKDGIAVTKIIDSDNICEILGETCSVIIDVISGIHKGGFSLKKVKRNVYQYF